MLRVVACMLAVVCKRTQQLPTLLAQLCWELLRPCWQWCVNRCNNSQQCWDLQCLVGRKQPIRLWRPCVRCACVAPTMLEALCKRVQHYCVTLRRSRNERNVGCVGSKVWPVSNFAQQLPTTSNKMQQGVQTDTTCNIRQFSELSVRLHKVLGTLRFKDGSLRIQRFLLAPRRLGRLARRNVRASATEIPYWWGKSMFT